MFSGQDDRTIKSAAFLATSLPLRGEEAFKVHVLLFGNRVDVQHGIPVHRSHGYVYSRVKDCPLCDAVVVQFEREIMKSLSTICQLPGAGKLQFTTNIPSLTPWPGRLAARLRACAPA